MQNEIASKQQVKMFFALAHELNYEAEAVKERARKHFKLSSFKNATKDQLRFLIDRLLIKIKEKQLKNEIR